MERGFVASARVGCARSSVWERLVDWKQAPAWMPGILDVHLLEGDPVGLGTRLRFVSKGSDGESRVTMWVPGRALALRQRRGGIEATYTYTLHDEADGATRVELDARCRASGSWWIVLPLIAFLMKRSDARQVQLFKRFVEAG